MTNGVFSAAGRVFCVLALSLVPSLVLLPQHAVGNRAVGNRAAGPLRAGAAVVDVTPTTLPVIVNGGMTARTTDQVTTRLKARAIAVADDETTIVIVVVDSCMMPRPLLDEAKQLASRRTGIPADHMLVSATHTHTAGSCMGALGTPADENYVPFLTEKLADTIVQAAGRLQPAVVGYATIDAAEFTALRRWIHRPGFVEDDPFGNPTVRANMHSARNLNNVVGPSGPEDPQLSLISFQTPKGEPLAVLANFSMHYFSGEQGLSADYFGYFCQGLQNRVAPGTDFVAIMSHGCSGDIWRRDYANPDSWDDFADIKAFAAGLVNRATIALGDIEYSPATDGIAMAERRMTLRYRQPDVQRLEWAQKVVDGFAGRLPKTRPEIYAAEQLILHERQQTEVVTQAVRIGEIAIATTPNETYAVTGLKIKAASPLPDTMVIELANGGDGYIPPPEQHLWGGYNTWAARSAGLEVTAEPKIVQSCLSLLEQVSGRERRGFRQPVGPAARTIRSLNPRAWYRLDDPHGPRAADSSAHGHDAIYEAEVTYYLPGPHSQAFTKDTVNRCAMFAGGRLRCQLPQSADWTISLWCWNGMPHGMQDMSGWLLSHGPDFGVSAASEHLGIVGRGDLAGRLMWQQGPGRQVTQVGSTAIKRWTWNHVALVRSADSLVVYLNGQREFGVTAKAGENVVRDLFVGGRSDGDSSWQGRLDEVAMFDRLLSAAEIRRLAATAHR